LRGFSSSVSTLAPSGTEPYTSSVEIWMKRSSPLARRAASSSTQVPSTSVRMKSPACSSERSTCVSAAKCTTIADRSTSGPATAASAMSPWTNSCRGSCITSCRFSRRPA
jgi:hypothetical protein